MDRDFVYFAPAQCTFRRTRCTFHRRARASSRARAACAPADARLTRLPPARTVQALLCQFLLTSECQRLRGELLGNSNMKTSRRDLLKAGATMVGVASGVSAASETSPGQAVPSTPGKRDMLYRSLGRTGAHVSALGVGGHHLGDFQTVDEAIRLVHEAIDAGITFSITAGSITTAKPKISWAGRSRATETRCS